ncbi:hypothetical protein K1719_001619 [Acacia pycnantha]|nr:hypothetical protein K1719_001619 [Acacia pycnantha]
MKQTVMDGDAPFLPSETVMNILKRLPVKSLIRFHCVCKDWKNLFKSPPFIADHLNHSAHHNPYLLLQQNHEYVPLRLELLNCDMQLREVQNPPLIRSLSCVKVIGSSNGLLCVEIESPSSLLLWNPATRETRQVPITRATNHFNYDCMEGFGYSPTVNDYKLVRTFAEPNFVIYEVEVYSLSTGLWKEIELGDLEGIQLFDDGVCANGTIFWLGLRLVVEEDGEDDDMEVLVSFDIAMEVFTVIPITCPGLKLTVYEDKIAAISSYRIEGRPYYHHYLFQLWVMEEDSSEERWSWEMKYTSRSPCPFDLHPGTIWRNEIVMSGIIGKIGRGKQNNELTFGLRLFNVTTNDSKMFAIPRHNPMCGVFNYVESLVPVGNKRINEPSS